MTLRTNATQDELRAIEAKTYGHYLNGTEEEERLIAFMEKKLDEQARVNALHNAQVDEARKMFMGIPPHKKPPTSDIQISYALDRIHLMLLAKNKAYGNSALDPVRIFSRADTTEQLRVRIDDKLSRIMRGTGLNAVPEDTLLDLIGYLVLLLVQQSTPPTAGFADEVRAAQTREVK